MSDRIADLLAILDEGASSMPGQLSPIEASTLVVGLLNRATTIALASSGASPEILKQVSASLYDILVDVRAEVVRTTPRQ